MASQKVHFSPSHALNKRELDPVRERHLGGQQKITLPELFTTQPMAGVGERRWEGDREGKKEKKNKNKHTHTTSLSVDFLSKSQQTVQSGTESGFSQLNLTSDAPESFMSIREILAHLS